jgi:hypothetical protein
VKFLGKNRWDEAVIDAYLADLLAAPKRNSNPRVPDPPNAQRHASPHLVDPSPEDCWPQPEESEDRSTAL